MKTPVTPAAGGVPGAAVRAAAARTLGRVLAGNSLDGPLASACARFEKAADRVLLRAICYTTLRHYPRLRFFMSALLSKPLRPQERDLEALICAGLCQIALMRTPEHAAVSGTVEAARDLGRPRAAGLVNAVLRRFLRERAQLEERANADEEASSCHPAWLIERLREDWPGAWQSIVAENNLRAPMWLRVNLRRQTRDEWADRYESETGSRPQVSAFAPAALSLSEPVDVDQLPGFRAGEVSVQDAAAQLAAGLLAPEPGMRVLDACAAPGGKTGHLLEFCPEIALTAVDKDAQRLARVRENLDRLGLDARLVAGDAGGGTWWDGQRFERILLDAPCSASGVIRRHPDIKLLHRPGDISALATRQAALLDGLWKMLAPGGRLVYATCSVFAAENAGQIDAFLLRHRDGFESFSPSVPVWGHAQSRGRQLLPGEDGMDGFYYACVHKRPVEIGE